jgi:uncharacterized membrane protein YidH (DUF202 family)
MIVFDFIYFCIYSFVPNKAIFGKRDVACTYLSCFTSMFLFGLFMICARLCKFELNNFHILLFIIILICGLIYLTRMTFLKPKKFRSMHRRFRKIPQWLLKTIGIMYLFLCFFGLVGLIVFSVVYLGM